MFELAPFLVLLPLGGFAINLIFAKRLREPTAGVVASAAAGLTFGAAVLLFIALLSSPAGATAVLADWIAVGTLRVPWAFQVDTLSVTMALVVSGIGTLIHVYAIGYMRGDARYTRFFVYMNLFLAAMLLLVMADSFLMLFVGWEGVGLCSFLLIGFWFDRPGGAGWRNSSAARKAFIVNRIGDFGMVLAIALLLWTTGSLRFADVFAETEAVFVPGGTAVTLIALLLLLGVAGKSAQVPLFVWLPDAMAGPTPVSALIHAATMVTAGVYLIIRAHPIFNLAPAVQEVVAAVGVITALLAGSAAAAQFDIKRVLAYSTISQLGFMVTAAGLGAYAGALFHLVTHAFFKALLFLAAGSVIHALAHAHQHRVENVGPFDAQDMRNMGGLRRRMPVTFWTFSVGALALTGLPPLAGFFSKDEILAAASHHSSLMFAGLLTAALLTAFYAGRQVLLVFFAAPRSEAAEHASENPLVMTWPLTALALLAVVGGALNLPGSHLLSDWLAYTVSETQRAEFLIPVALASTALVLVGLVAAYVLYGGMTRGAAEDPLARRVGRLYTVLADAWGIDALYQRYIVNVFDSLGSRLARADRSVSSGVEGGLAHTLQRLGRAAARTQTGQLNWNAAGIAIGFILVLLIVLAGRGA
ncbi:MAG: NADH-quinone oxidoreductase subunit L [Aggregatilineales bacterium]